MMRSALGLTGNGRSAGSQQLKDDFAHRFIATIESVIHRPRLFAHLQRALACFLEGRVPEKSPVLGAHSPGLPALSANTQVMFLLNDFRWIRPLMFSPFQRPSRA
jgi:hypothetical protein